MAALDLFKQTGKETLPVCRRGRPIGTLSKQRLLREITNVLGESATPE